MSLQNLASIVLFTLFAIPTLLVVEYSSGLHDSYTILGIGIGVLTSVTAVIFFFIPKPKNRDPWFYVFVLFSYCCVIDLVMSLEAQGLIRGWASFYFRTGEEYLDTPFGISINLWDGIVHYGIYMVMISRIYRGEDYRNLGLYWAGSILNSVVVLLFGGLTSGQPVHPAVFLNIPFLTIPIYFIVKELKASGSRTYHLTGPVKTVIKAYCTQSSVGTIIRILALSDCTIYFIAIYRETVEPSLIEATSFQKVQLILFITQCVPLFLCGSVGMFAGLLGPYLLKSSKSDLNYRQPSGFLFWAMQIWLLVGIHILSRIGSNARKTKLQKKD